MKLKLVASKYAQSFLQNDIKVHIFACFKTN
jgi:hypothetical protein